MLLRPGPDGVAAGRAGPECLGGGLAGGPRSCPGEGLEVPVLRGGNGASGAPGEGQNAPGQLLIVPAPLVGLQQPGSVRGQGSREVRVPGSGSASTPGPGRRAGQGRESPRRRPAGPRFPRVSARSSCIDSLHPADPRCPQGRPLPRSCAARGTPASRLLPTALGSRYGPSGVSLTRVTPQTHSRSVQAGDPGAGTGRTFSAEKSMSSSSSSSPEGRRPAASG